MDTLLSARQLAQAIGVSHQTVFNWTRSGRLPSYSCEDGHRRYDLADGIAAMTKTKPAAKRERGIPDPDPTIVGFCYSDAYGNIRVRFKDIMGKVHDEHISISTSTACDAEDIALPAEDYYAKPPPKRPLGYSYTDAQGIMHAVGPDERGLTKHTIIPDDRSILDKIAGEAAKHPASDTSPITDDLSHPCQKINLDPTNPVAFEFDDEPSATPFT